MNITSLNLPIPTERLVLRKFSANDFDAYAAYHSRTDVYQFLYMPPPAGQALQSQFSALLSAPFENDGDTLTLAAVRREDEAVLGEVLLKIASKSALQAEVGYIFNPVFARKGYASEAVKAVIGVGFEQVGCHRIFARLDTLNVGSIGVVERLGMRREAHLIQNDRFNGVWGNEYIYAILRKEHEITRSR